MHVLEDYKSTLVGARFLALAFLFAVPLFINAIETVSPAGALSFGAPIHSASSASSTYAIPIVFTYDEAPVNAARIEFYFNTDKLVVGDIEITDALCEERFVITKSIDTVSGSGLLECGTTTPLYAASTTLAFIHVAPKESGTTTLSFGTTTSVHAHDGFGTDVLKTAYDGTFFFSD